MLNPRLTVIENYNNIDSSESSFISSDERKKDMELINSICQTLEEINKKYMKFIKSQEYGQVDNSLNDYKYKLLHKALRETRAKILSLQNLPRRLWNNYHDVIEVDF